MNRFLGQCREDLPTQALLLVMSDSAKATYAHVFPQGFQRAFFSAQRLVRICFWVIESSFTKLSIFGIRAVYDQFMGYLSR